MKKHNLFYLFTIFLFISCNQPSKVEIKIKETKVNFSFIEFHKKFYNADEKELKILKVKYPYLFPSIISDREWMSKIKDSEEKVLFEIADSVYGDLIFEKKSIENLYKHIKYYIPTFKAPKTISLINGLDYDNSIIYADSLLLISLDMYLGANSEVYNSFPSYLAQNYKKENIYPDVAKKILQKEFQLYKGRSFLDAMLYYGKELYLIKKVLPQTPMPIIWGISEDKYNWCLHNESKIWSYFMSENLLFSTDKKLNNRFIDIAPFSKFYLENDNESPGRVGIWIGYKIIESFMENNKISLHEMTQLDSETIFKKSKYKPSKQ